MFHSMKRKTLVAMWGGPTRVRVSKGLTHKTTFGTVQIMFEVKCQVIQRQDICRAGGPHGSVFGPKEVSFSLLTDYNDAPDRRVEGSASGDRMVGRPAGGWRGRGGEEEGADGEAVPGASSGASWSLPPLSPLDVRMAEGI